MNKLTGGERTIRAMDFVRSLIENSKTGDGANKLGEALDKVAAEDLNETLADMQALSTTTELVLLGLQIRGAIKGLDTAAFTAPTSEENLA